MNRPKQSLIASAFLPLLSRTTEVARGRIRVQRHDEHLEQHLGKYIVESVHYINDSVSRQIMQGN